MSKNNDSLGYWHFSSEPDHCYSGFLINTAEEIAVTLLGCIKTPPDSSILHGTTVSGKKITLYKCRVFKRSMSMPGIPSIEISAQYCIKGEHLNLGTLSFESALLEISDLEDWVNVDGFRDYIRNDEVISINYNALDPITFYEDEEILFALQFQASSPMFSPTNKFEITQKTWLLIKHKSSFDLDQFWKYVSTITGFLTVAYFSDPKILKIKFRHSKKILSCNYLGQDIVSSRKKKSRRDFLFEYDVIRNDFTQIFKKWFELENIIEPVIDIMEEAFGHRSTIAENRFLNVIQGIETFHRRRRKNEKEPKEIYKRKVSAIINACPDEQVSWLKDKLNFCNEPTLQDRLNDLFSELSPELIEHLYPDYIELILKAKKNRNYYTHYDRSYEKKALKPGDLFYLTERLKVFLLILLLKEIEMKPEQLDTIIIDGSQFLFNHLIAKKKKKFTTHL